MLETNLQALEIIIVPRAYFFTVRVYFISLFPIFVRKFKEIHEVSELHLNGDVLEALDAMRFEECTPYKKNQFPSYSKVEI